jgi:hypothetical protein
VYTCCQIAKWANEQWLAWFEATQEDSKVVDDVTSRPGIEGASRAIKIMAGWMPARVGADESGIAGAFLAFGLSPASGLTLALARRSRDLLAALIGLSWLALRAGFLKVSSALIPKAAYSKEEEITCKLC